MEKGLLGVVSGYYFYKIILDIIIKQNGNFTHKCCKINSIPSLVTLMPIVINLSLVINLRSMTIVKW